MNQQERLNIEDVEIDFAGTLHNARLAIKKYRRYLLQTDDEYLPQITPAYSLEPRGGNSEYNGSTERVIKYIDREREREQFLNDFWRAVNRMSAADRRIIVSQYMGREEKLNFEMCKEFDWSERHYDRKKKEALKNLAIALGVQVEK